MNASKHIYNVGGGVVSKSLEAWEHRWLSSTVYKEKSESAARIPSFYRQDISSSRRSFNWHFFGGWYLDVEKPICHLSLLPILLNCVRSHVDLYCVRSVRVSSSSDR